MTQAHAINSTNVRFNSSWALHALASAAPGAASMVAETLFTLPRRFARSDWEKTALAAGTRVPLRVGNRELAAWQWGSGNRTALLVHGWSGRGSQLGAFAAPLVRAGHRVVAFDAPAHGDSPGITTTIADFRDAILAADERFGKFDAIIAHSLGAAAVTLAIDAGLAPAAVAMIAPPVSPLPTLDALTERLAFGSDARQHLFERLERRVGMAPEALDVTRIASSFNVPALVVHDRRDRFVPWENGLAIARAWPGATLVSTDGFGHGRILRAQQTVDAVTRFVIDATPPGVRGDLDRWLDAVEARHGAVAPASH